MNGRRRRGVAVHLRDDVVYARLNDAADLQFLAIRIVHTRYFSNQRLAIVCATVCPSQRGFPLDGGSAK